MKRLAAALSFLCVLALLPAAASTYEAGDTISGEATHYCVCKKCCGKTDGVTASGQVIANGMEDPYIIACNWLPLGSIIEIDGIQYTVADRGGKSLSRTGRIDIYVPAGHEAALELGRKDVEIVILEKGGARAWGYRKAATPISKRGSGRLVCL